MRWKTPVGVVVMLSLTACGSNSGSKSGAASPTRSPTAASTTTVEPVTTTVDPATTTVTTSPPASASLSDGDVAVRCTSDQFEVDTVDPSTGATTPVVSVTASGLADWTTHDFACGDRASWSRDFQYIVFSGSLAASTDGSTHIGYVNLQTGGVTDLTALHQGSGFGAPTLSETAPAFISNTTGAIAFGASDVGFLQTRNANASGGTDHAMMLDIADPSTVRPLPGGSVDSIAGQWPSRWGAAGHGELDVTELDTQDPDSGVTGPGAPGSTIQSTDGKWLVNDNDLGALTAGAATGQGLQLLRAGTEHWTVVDDTLQMQLLGWIGPTDFVAWGPANSAGSTITVFRVAPTGMAKPVRSLLPANAQQIASVWLGLDDANVYFSAPTSHGTVDYSVPVAGGAVTQSTSPQQTQHLFFPA